MFGYATDETEECMPLTIVLAHKLNAKMAELRRNGRLPWLRPDSKTQVGHVFCTKLHFSKMLCSDLLLLLYMSCFLVFFLVQLILFCLTFKSKSQSYSICNLMKEEIPACINYVATPRLFGGILNLLDITMCSMATRWK